MRDDRLHESQQIRLREAARDLRQRSTPTARRLWSVLRGRQVGGWRFRRQHPVGPYIVDFLCFEVRLVIEIDGPIHELQREYDAERDDVLAQNGYRVLRFSAESISRDLPAVLQQIWTACQAPPLPRAGEGGGG